MKAIKLQSGNKLHHYWLSQYIKAIVLHQREFEFEFWPIRKFHFIQPGPVPSTILNYCPIRWLLFHLPSWILVQSQAELPSWIIVQSEDCFLSAILHFWPIRDKLPPSTPPWHRTLTSTLLKFIWKTYNNQKVWVFGKVLGCCSFLLFYANRQNLSVWRKHNRLDLQHQE